VLLALLSDLHANLEALTACLEHARHSGAERYAFLGDLVGYGADPAAVVEIVRSYADEGAVVLKGNHDAAVARYGGMSDGAQDAIAWTRAALNQQAKAWLDSLPLCIRDDELCLVHASAERPDRWEYVDTPGAARRSAAAAGVPWTFCGHVHRQTLFFETSPGRMTEFAPVPGTALPVHKNRRWVAVVGSVGQPRERNPAAAYALFDARRERLTFHRVAYDHATAARKIRAAGLPDVLLWGNS
jgi:diadenosine tetraphosphatase ApaH/serine/threonine PP2A family protein phosphatase